MKNLKILVLLFAIGIGACKKEDSKPDPKTTIVGKWKLDHYVEINYKNGVKQDEATRLGADITLEFKNDKDAVFDGSAYTYEVEGNNRVKLTSDGETEPEIDFEITKITNNELNLFLERSRTRSTGDVTKTTDELFFKK